MNENVFSEGKPKSHRLIALVSRGILATGILAARVAEFAIISILKSLQAFPLFQGFFPASPSFRSVRCKFKRLRAPSFVRLLAPSRGHVFAKQQQAAAKGR